jgi:hypothetical protein
MELFAEDRGMHVAAQPRQRDRPKTQLFHPSQNSAHGTISLNEVNNVSAECFAG